MLLFITSGDEKRLDEMRNEHELRLDACRILGFIA